MTSLDEVRDWIGRTIKDREGDKLGTVDHAYVERGTDAPSFLAVKTGLFGKRSSLVPAERVRLDGDDLVVPSPPRWLETLPMSLQTRSSARSKSSACTDTTTGRLRQTPKGDSADTERAGTDSVIEVDHSARAANPQQSKTARWCAQKRR